jgi:hypothetical protein
MVIVLLFQEAVTPVGRPVADPIPDAPLVVMVIGVSAVLIQIVGLLEGVAEVFEEVTVIVPVALIVPHPPVSGIV